MVTRKEEKKKKEKKKKDLFLAPGQPFSRSAGSAAGQAAVSPSPTLSRLRPAACTGEPGTDLSTQASPTPKDQGQGQGLPCTPTPAPRAQRSDGKVSGRIWGQHGSRRPSPSRTCLARPGPHPAPRGAAPCLGAGSVAGPHLAPTHPLRTWFAQQEPKPRAQRRNTAGRGEENIRETHTRANAPAVGRRLAPVDASRRTPGCLGTSGQGDPPPGCGNADS